MLSGVAKFQVIITIMVVICECFEAVRDTIDNGSLGVGPKTNNTKTIPDSKPATLYRIWAGYCIGLNWCCFFKATTMLIALCRIIYIWKNLSKRVLN